MLKHASSKSELICCICQEQQQHPWVFPCHQHSACFTCVIAMISSHSSYEISGTGTIEFLCTLDTRCPLCNTPETWFDYYGTELHSFTVSALDICYGTQEFKCPYCGISGLAGMMSNHLPSCSQLTYTCPLCQEPYLRNEGETHVKACSRLLCSVSTCHYTGSYEELIIHAQFHKQVTDLASCTSALFDMLQDWNYGPDFKHPGSELTMFRTQAHQCFSALQKILPPDPENPDLFASLVRQLET